MNNYTKAVIFMILSSLSFALMTATVKLAGDIPTFQKVLFRNIVSLFIAFYYVKVQKAKLFGSKDSFKYLLARSLIGLLGIALFFYAVDHLYLADSSLLNKLHPFFVTLFAWLFLKEKISKYQIPALILVFIAAMLIIKPKFDYTVIPALSGFLSAMCAGAAYTLVRHLRNLEKPATIVFFFSFISVVVMIPITIPIYVEPTAIQWVYLILTGAFAAGGQFGLTYAYKLAEAGEISIYNYTNVVFAAIIGYFIWGEISDIWTIIGGMIIISIAIFLVINKKNS